MQACCSSLENVLSASCWVLIATVRRSHIWQPKTELPATDQQSAEALFAGVKPEHQAQVRILSSVSAAVPFVLGVP